MSKEILTGQEDVEQKSEKKDQKSTKTMLRIFAVAIAAVTIITLAVIKASNPAFPLLTTIIIGVAIIAACTVTFFIFNIIDGFKQKNLQALKDSAKLPKPVSLGELTRMAEGAMVDRHFANHLKACKNYRYATVGKHIKNLVFVYEAEALYTSGMKNGVVYILINAHYPIDRRAILIDPSPAELNNAIKSLGTDPEEDMEETVIERENPILGTKERITERKKPKEEQKRIETHSEEEEEEK